MKKLLLILFMLAIMREGVCQLCTGSLGDPMVNITFGNTAGPLKPGITNLAYVNTSCPNDGQYTIINQIGLCFNASWYTAFGDHTGNPNGQMMLVNASINPNDFYVDTVSGLCGNTTFEFAAWVANILRPTACNGTGTRPNLTFRIELTDGTVLLKYDSGDIPGAGNIVWKQYGTFFTTPPGVTKLVLRITNNAPGGCGNDLALDDITFRPCGAKISTVIRSSQTTSIEICEKQTASIAMDATSTATFAGSIVQWQLSIDSGQTWKDISGARTPSYTHVAGPAGVFEYRTVAADAANFGNAQCRIASNTSTVTVHPLPASLARSMLGCTGHTVVLSTAHEDSTNTYQWTGPNNFSSTQPSPVINNATLNDSGLYRFTVRTRFGCSGRDSIRLRMGLAVTAGISMGTTICAGASTQLNATGGGGYTWTPARGLSDARIANPVASPSDTTVYQVLVSNADGCSDSARVTIAVFKSPDINAGPDKQIFEGQSVTLDGSINGSYLAFYWSPSSYMSNSNSLTPTVSPLDSTTYTLYVTGDPTCPAGSDHVLVRVYKKLQIPNAFSPNGDGINDTWKIKGLETYPNPVVSVFDRKGILVFKSNSNIFAWDGIYNGKALGIDTYYYVVDVNMNNMPVLSGWVVIVK